MYSRSQVSHIIQLDMQLVMQPQCSNDHTRQFASYVSGHGSGSALAASRGTKSQQLPSVLET